MKYFSIEKYGKNKFRKKEMSFRNPKFRLLRNCIVFSRTVDEDDGGDLDGEYLDMQERGEDFS